MMIRNWTMLLFVASIHVGCQSSNREDKVADSLGKETEILDTGSDEIANSSQSLENIAAIQDAYVATVDNRKAGRLDSTFFEYDCDGEKNGRVVYFSEEGQLVLIRHDYGEYSHQEYEEEYFVRDNKLFFAFEKATSWTFESGAAEGATKDDVTETRIYYQNEHAFRCLQKQYVVRSKSLENPIPEELPNKELDCQKASSSLATFQLLIARRENPTNDCLKKAD
ncbi:hypothetical protein [Sphingobacterium deserti]|uniref:Uncharacterized protein n=1 Tax=Sphingobacterium deserti TaxID=1229276 RepID=A0A0B8TB35_9SPHI|nr:hypothetical protein [Sphingobacterium deserti]KGE16089.1 hypothetical protein DI53_0204 [Sphingobacterium deserti]